MKNTNTMDIEPEELVVGSFCNPSLGPRRQLALKRVPSRLPGLSIVIPVYNEAENLHDLVRQVSEAAHELGMDWELILVDDASNDESSDIFESIVSSNVRVLQLTKNRGQSTATEIGFKSARYDTFATLDGDLQNDPKDLKLLLEKLPGADLVCGHRQNRQDNAWRRFVSRSANRIRQRFTGDTVSDTGCSLKVFRASVVDQILFFHGCHRFFPALAEMEGFRVTEVPVSHHPRTKGVTKYGSLDRLKATLPDLLAMIWLKSRLKFSEAREV